MSAFVLPDHLNGFIQSRAAEGYDTPENYLVSLVERDQEGSDRLPGMTDAAADALEEILVSRNEGPFIRVSHGDTSFIDRVIAEGHRRHALARSDRAE
jgi:aminoglycoside phosphotransferase family enzyme